MSKKKRNRRIDWSHLEQQAERQLARNRTQIEDTARGTPGTPGKEQKQWTPKSRKKGGNL